MPPAAALPLMLFAAATAALAEPVCERRSGARPPLVVELYTSEGCSSCPPADRWLSGLKGRDDLLPLAFHVGYWNRLGWVDRFATTETTERQYRLARAMGAPNVYTPQVLAQGQDWRRWPDLPERPAKAPMPLRLERQGHQVVAEVGAAPGRWAGYWAVLEHGHRSRVTAGENRGEVLTHDHVVRRYQPVPAWQGPARFTLDLPAADAGHASRVVFVVHDPATERPVQALALDC